MHTGRTPPAEPAAGNRREYNLDVVTQLALINPENVSEAEAATYAVRAAARAVVLDGERNIALLHVSKKNYYKLPGGGVEEGEDIPTALDRGSQEEIGCKISVHGELGSIIEYRKQFKLVQTSSCYLAQVEGEKGAPDLTEEELNDGFEIVWLAPAEAERTLAGSRPTDYEGSYIVERDATFLRAAKIHLN